MPSKTIGRISYLVESSGTDVDNLRRMKLLNRRVRSISEIADAFGPTRLLPDGGWNPHSEDDQRPRFVLRRVTNRPTGRFAANAAREC